MRKLEIILFIVFGMILLSCSNQEKKSDTTKEDVKESINETIETTKKYAERTKEEWIEKFETIKHKANKEWGAKLPPPSAEKIN